MLNRFRNFGTTPARNLPNACMFASLRAGPPRHHYEHRPVPFSENLFRRALAFKMRVPWPRSRPPSVRPPTHPPPRRILSRTWKCDRYLHAVSQGAILGKHSIAQLIQHSLIFRERYARHVKQMQKSPIRDARIKSLRAAKHRFESFQQPFGRCILTWEAVLRTAQEIHEERRTQAPGKHAKTFLQQCDEEFCVSLAMQADAGDEGIQLTRHVEAEFSDNAALTREAHTFIGKIQALFEKEGCRYTGYTFFMLEFLKKPTVLFVDREPKNLGGKSPAYMEKVIQRCLTRLKAWTTLAKTVVASEFPHFEILQAFRVLELRKSGERRNSSPLDDVQVSAQINKLAQFFGMNEQALRDQYEDHKPVAQKLFDEQTVTPWTAWKNAIEYITKSPRPQRALKAHPVNELVDLLARSAGMGSSTAGVERLFSIANKHQSATRADVNIHTFEDEMHILSAKGLADSETHAVATCAQHVWKTVYRNTRASKRPRRPMAGKFAKTAVKKHSLKAWVKKRRSEVNTLCKALSDVPCDTADQTIGVGAWTETHEKEMEFQRAKKQFGHSRPWKKTRFPQTT